MSPLINDNHSDAYASSHAMMRYPTSLSRPHSSRIVSHRGCRGLLHPRAPQLVTMSCSLNLSVEELDHPAELIVITTQEVISA